MPVSTTETLPIEEILKKLEVAGPMTSAELLKFLIGDTDQLRVFQESVLRKLKYLSETTLNELITEINKKVRDPNFVKKMADPLGLTELQPEYKRKTSNILDESVRNISNELGKIKIKETDLNEDISKALSNKIDQIKIEDVDLNKIVADKINIIDLTSKLNLTTPPAATPAATPPVVIPAPATPPAATPPAATPPVAIPAPASSVLDSTKLSILLENLNKTLKSIQLKKTLKKEPTKITFSLEALKRLQNVTGFDRGLIKQLEQRILNDPSTKIKQSFIRKQGLGKRAIYETGEKSVNLSEKSLKNIFDSLNINNDDQEKLLFALSTESKEIKDELKGFKKGMLESPWAMLLNGLAKFFTDIFLLSSLAVGGGIATIIGKYFGPTILGWIDGLFGTKLAPAFDNITKPLQAMGNKLTALAAGVVALGSVFGYLAVAGLRLTTKLTGAALNFFIGKPLVVQRF